LEAHHLPLAINPVSLEQFLNELEAETQGLREQSGLTFVWQQAAELPVLHTDSRKLKVVIKNLISNAVKFTEHGKIMIATQARDNGVEISVTDTGIGIPAEAVATIFEPFRQLELSMTRRYKGTGLGLHIVKRMLELLDGLISVESEVGCGSTFRVWIPLRASRS
jgi:signal transduction histidine kinase